MDNIANINPFCSYFIGRTVFITRKVVLELITVMTKIQTAC